MGLSHTIPKINGDFSQKSQFAQPLLHCTPLKMFPWELGTGTRSQKPRMMRVPGTERSLTISSAMWIQYTDELTDRHRVTAKTTFIHNTAR